ncbi:Flp family type IVb pilin [Pseudacidovorax sp. RU35E]|jgi:pilus assembly protein Flp/PilA|uniref:Flp family type IVb pilin n=1 Tax=Pseudacidovorax sp. RU35E TaxID=1907403 RepID=UPI0009573EB8|nr:Flp family type IVb pilin [Pseudacidovorax sp. RU35E]SIR20577.1 pilus assembly protein Flp/PilA [Pseudacidovorax sp. RU35E]
MQAAIVRFLRDEEGATAIEYGIIAGLMALVLVAIFGNTGIVRDTLNTIFTNVQTVATTGAAG